MSQSVAGAILDDREVADTAPLPLVLFDADICRALRISLSTLKRLRNSKTFPIPEILPKLDKRRRYSRRDVEAYLARETPARRRPR